MNDRDQKKNIFLIFIIFYDGTEHKNDFLDMMIVMMMMRTKIFIFFGLEILIFYEGNEHKK